MKKETEIKELIGKLIKKERMKQKLSQQDLASLLKVDRQYVWRIENGKINLTLDYLGKILASIGVHPKEIFPNKTEQKRK